MYFKIYPFYYECLNYSFPFKLKSSEEYSLWLNLSAQEISINLHIQLIGDSDSCKSTFTKLLIKLLKGVYFFKQ